MFEDSLLINIIIFLLGQIAAWGYLRTGMIGRGTFLIVATWVLADLALVSHFAYQEESLFRSSLMALQVCSTVGFLLFSSARVRRRSSWFLRLRHQRMREAFVHYLRNEFSAAILLYRRQLRKDPWDIHAKLGLATAVARCGTCRAGTVRRLFKSVRRLDREHHFNDVIEDELSRI